MKEKGNKREQRKKSPLKKGNWGRENIETASEADRRADLRERQEEILAVTTAARATAKRAI